MARGRITNDTSMSSDLTISGHVDDWAELAVDYLDGRLDSATNTAVQTHLDECPACAARLAAQREIVALMGAQGMADVPEDLEARVLEQALQTAAPARVTRLFSRRRAGTPIPERHRTVLSPSGPWLPALAGAAAVLVLVLALTVSRGPVSLNDTDTTFAAMAEEMQTQPNGDAGATQPDTTSQVLLGSGDGSNGGQTDTGTAETQTSRSMVSLQPTGPYLQDEASIAGSLAEADTTAFVFFDTADGSPVTAAQADALAAEFTSATGLRLMDSTQSSGVRAFAAFVPRDDAAAIVGLLCSIGGTHQLSVCLSLDPGSEVIDWADSMLKDKYGVAELSALPATPSGWSFTTSTAPPTTTGTAATPKATPLDEMGAHVLMVIFMAVQD